MKKIVILIFMVAFTGVASAQLANTSWKGNFNIPDPAEMILQFKTDTVFLNFPDKTTLETMSYKISNDTMLIVKIDGQSPCNYTDKATYKIFSKMKKFIFRH